MKRTKHLVALMLVTVMVMATASSSLIQGKPTGSHDFYFVHISDVHVKNKLFDKNEVSKHRFMTILENISRFPSKPAFVVITGDLAHWGGSGLFGALNCRTVVSCLHEKEGQLYVDDSYTIPVYTTPGNHEYAYTRSLKNYHTYIDKNHVLEDDRYIVTRDDVTLFFMDSGPNYYSNLSILFDWHGTGLSDADISWLDDGLRQCQTSHKIVLMHHPAVGDADDLFINNREAFVGLCESNHVELVLAGHTHSNHRIFDVNMTLYVEPINCSRAPPLYVQSDDCAEDCHYRNVSLIGSDVWLGENTEIDLVP